MSRPGDSFADIATTAGVPCDGVEVPIAESDSDLLAPGYSVMQGYLDDAGATAPAIDAMAGCIPETSAGSTTMAGY